MSRAAERRESFSTAGVAQGVREPALSSENPCIYMGKNPKEPKTRRKPGKTVEILIGS